MGKTEVDGLAATLKAAGLAASFYDAMNMAKSITDGVEKHSDVDSRIAQASSRGASNFIPLSPQQFEPVRQSSAYPVRQQPVYTNRPVEQPVAPRPVPVFEPAVSTYNIPQPAPMSLVSVPVYAPQPAPATVPEPVQAAPAESLSIFKEPEPVAAMRPDFVLQPPLEKEVTVQPAAPVQYAQPQVVHVEEARVAPAFIPVSAPVAAPAPQPAQQAPAQPQKYIHPSRLQNTEPLPQVISNNQWFHELEIDKSKPRPELTDTEKKNTDLCKWFNFSKR